MHEPGIRLAERLVDLIGLPGRVFFANSGAEANECAVKLSRKHGRKLDPSGSRTEIVAATGSFHGRTLGALAITGNPAKREPFTPLPGPVTFVDYGDSAALRAAVTDRTAAVFIETTLGEGGVVPAPAGYLQDARAACDATGALLVVDEVQSGIGRTGHWFASLSEGVRPDVLTLAKGLGGGLPIGACIGIGDAGDLFAPGDHGSTFGGNPLAAAVGEAALDLLVRERLSERARVRGDELIAKLRAIDHGGIFEVRGKGLLVGVEIDPAFASARAVCEGLLGRGVLSKDTHGTVVRFAPPLVVESEHVDLAVDALRDTLRSLERRAG
jgi:acetylornithine aminotransferase